MKIETWLNLCFHYLYEFSMYRRLYAIEYFLRCSTHNRTAQRHTMTKTFFISSMWSYINVCCCRCVRNREWTQSRTHKAVRLVENEIKRKNIYAAMYICMYCCTLGSINKLSKLDKGDEIRTKITVKNNDWMMKNIV